MKTDHINPVLFLDSKFRIELGTAHVRSLPRFRAGSAMREPQQCLFTRAAGLQLESMQVVHLVLLKVLHLLQPHQQLLRGMHLSGSRLSFSSLNPKVQGTTSFPVLAFTQA